MSIWIPIIITLVACLVWYLLVYPGKWRAEASIIASAAALIAIALSWLAYGVAESVKKL